MENARSAEVTALWRMLTSPQNSLQKAEDLISEESLAKFTLFPKTSHNFRFHHAVESSLLPFPRVNEKEGKMGKSTCVPLQNFPWKSLKCSSLSCQNASSYIKVGMKAGSKEICNKFLLSQTINFHTKLHNILVLFSLLQRVVPKNSCKNFKVLSWPLLTVFTVILQK